MAKQIVKLASLAQEPTPVDISATQQIMVRALTLREMVQLLIESKDAFLSLYAAGITADVESLAPFLLSAPELVAKIIALASDEPDMADKVERGLGGPVQLIALTEIWKVSVPDPKKALELLSEVTALLRNANEKREKELQSKDSTMTLQPQ